MIFAQHRLQENDSQQLRDNILNRFDAQIRSRISKGDVTFGIAETKPRA